MNCLNSECFYNILLNWSRLHNSHTCCVDKQNNWIWLAENSFTNPIYVHFTNLSQSMATPQVHWTKNSTISIHIGVTPICPAESPQSRNFGKLGQWLILHYIVPRIAENPVTPLKAEELSQMWWILVTKSKDWVRYWKEKKILILL